MAMSDLPLDAATSGDLRRLVGEVLAEVAAKERSAPGAPRPVVRPASELAAGGIPSGVPPGRPAADPTDRATGPGDWPTAAMNGPTVGIFRDDWANHRDAASAAWPTHGAKGTTAWDVLMQTDADLREFALRVLRLADNPKMRRDLIAGRIRFRLASETSPAATAPAVQRVDKSAVTERAVAAATAAAVHRVDKGAVTERAVAAAASAGARLVLGPRAVLTPLAKDKARALGVPIERER